MQDGMSDIEEHFLETTSEQIKTFSKSVSIAAQNIFLTESSRQPMVFCLNWGILYPGCGVDSPFIKQQPLAQHDLSTIRCFHSKNACSKLRSSFSQNYGMRLTFDNYNIAQQFCQSTTLAIFDITAPRCHSSLVFSVKF